MTTKQHTKNAELAVVSPGADGNGNGRSTGNGRGRPTADRPLITLPPIVPQQAARPTQSNVPGERTMRDRLRHIATDYIATQKVIPPLSMDELRRHTIAVMKQAGLEPRYRDYAAIIVSNETWRDTLAQIPYDRRLLLLPKCLRVEDRCPAPFDEFGLLCKDCGLCSIQDLTAEAERLGYAVLVAEGSAIVRQMIETGRIEAVVGVSCINVLEKCFPHMEAAAIPGVAVPLLQDDCVNTNVDLDWVWDVIHLTSDDKTYRLDLESLKADVRSWFTPDSLTVLMGTCDGETEAIARDWLSRAGKRWRPYLTVCVAMALQSDHHDRPPPITENLKKLAVAVECFHKASLVHDDIEDNDAQRYGQDALHIAHGMPVALNVGDFLLGEGYRLIGELDTDASAKVAMLRAAADGHLMLSRGQGAELCWARRPQPLSSLQVLDIFRRKTAPAFEVALRLGAHFVGVEDGVHRVLSEYSEALGIAYQIRDDLEDFNGQGDSHDLRDLRPSVMLAIAHKRAAAGAEKDLLASLWRRESDYAAVADQIARVFDQRGVTDKARDLLDAYREQAIRSLAALSNPTLKGLLRRVVGKIFGEQLIEGYCSEFEARNAAGRAVGAEPAA